jgi:hypothetical protein
LLGAVETLLTHLTVLTQLLVDLSLGPSTSAQVQIVLGGGVKPTPPSSPPSCIADGARPINPHLLVALESALDTLGPLLALLLEACKLALDATRVVVGAPHGVLDTTPQVLSAHLPVGFTQLLVTQAHLSQLVVSLVALTEGTSDLGLPQNPLHPTKLVEGVKVGLLGLSHLALALGKGLLAHLEGPLTLLLGSLTHLLKLTRRAQHPGLGLGTLLKTTLPSPAVLSLSLSEGVIHVPESLALEGVDQGLLGAALDGVEEVLFASRRLNEAAGKAKIIRERAPSSLQISRLLRPHPVQMLKVRVLLVGHGRRAACATHSQQLLQQGYGAMWH